ncbi:MAG: hypothetical protein JSS26_16500 [Nitrospira sp.]|nr:hypothetical protein [Nitrospira sp.]
MNKTRKPSQNQAASKMPLAELLRRSAEDRVLTKRLREAADLFGIPLLDHLVLAEDRYYSFADQGWPDA